MKFTNNLNGGLDRRAFVFHSPKYGTVLVDPSKIEALRVLRNKLVQQHDYIAAENIIFDSMYGIECCCIFSGTNSWLVFENEPPMEVVIIADNPFSGSVITEAEEILK